MEHYLVGQCVRDYIYGECMTQNMMRLNKIISIDDDFITLVNVQMKVENNKWIPSDVIGDKKLKFKLNYPRTTSKNKKDKTKLHQKAIDDLGFYLYNNDLYFPDWSGHDCNERYSNIDTFEVYENLSIILNKQLPKKSKNRK